MDTYFGMRGKFFILHPHVFYFSQWHPHFGLSTPNFSHLDSFFMSTPHSIITKCIDLSSSYVLSWTTTHHLQCYLVTQGTTIISCLKFLSLR